MANSGSIRCSRIWQKCGYYCYSLLVMRVSRPHSDSFFVLELKFLSNKQTNWEHLSKSRGRLLLVRGHPQWRERLTLNEITSEFWFLPSFFDSSLDENFVVEIPFPRENFHFVSFICSSHRLKIPSFSLFFFQNSKTNVVCNFWGGFLERCFHAT
jgi:hypothetical protein